MLHEGIVGRGGNEDELGYSKCSSHSSHLKEFLKSGVTGLNKNQMVWIVADFHVVQCFDDTIDLTFFVSGLSYMHCDRNFDVIEKRK